MNRNPGVELLRAALMFGIVLLHTCDHSVRDCQWLSYMMCFCVTGFVFITGYYGVSFRPKKILKLYGIAVVCCLLSALTERHAGVMAYLLRCYRHFLSCWFVHCYVALLFMAPMLNAALEHPSWVMPFFLLVFGWSYACSFGVTGGIVPFVPGFGSHTLMMMMGVYVAARLFRMREIEKRISSKGALFAGIPLFCFGALGFSRYNSVFAVTLSGLLFAFFKRISVGPVLDKVIIFLGPSLFSVYVLHNSDHNEALTSRLGALLMDAGFPVWAGCVLAAGTTFVACLFVDLVRRLCVCGLLTGFAVFKRS